MNKKLLWIPFLVLLALIIGYNSFKENNENINSGTVLKSEKAETVAKQLNSNSTKNNAQISFINKDTSKIQSDAHSMQDVVKIEPLYNKKNYKPEEAKVILDAVIGDNGFIDSYAVASALKSDDFDVFMDQLKNNASPQETEKEVEIEALLLDSADLANYNYELSCGIDICALNLRHIPQGDTQQLSQNITNDLPLGSIFKRNYEDEYGNANIRVLYQIEETSKLTTRYN